MTGYTRIDRTMIYYLTADYSEARFFIKRYGMKKLTDIKICQIFKSDNELLIISGRSAADAAVDLCHALTLFPLAHASGADILICLRSCGRDLSAGSGAKLCNKLTDRYSGRDYYPDVLLKHPFEEDWTEDDYAVFAYQAAVKFFPSHSIHILVAGEITADLTEAVAVWADARAGRILSEGVEFSEEEEQIIEKLCGNLRLSCAMRTGLREKIRRFVTRGGDLNPVWADYKDVRAGSKREGKELYEAIAGRLDK